MKARSAEWRNLIAISIAIKKIKTKDNIKYAIELIDKYGLSSFKKHYPNDLSGGMKQRVSLIRTLVLRPNLLLLDEPFSALDAQTRINVCEDVSKILRAEKKTTILVTHDITEAISLSDRIIVLSSRPACVKCEYKMEFTTTSPRERRESPKFNEYFKQVWGDLQIENDKE